MGPNAVADAIAQKYNATKSQVFDHVSEGPRFPRAGVWTAAELTEARPGVGACSSPGGWQRMPVDAACSSSSPFTYPSS